MATGRKTVRISDVITSANNMLRNSVPEYDRERAGVCGMLETILHSAGAYHGYQDVSVSGAPDGYGKRRQYYGGDLAVWRATYDVELHSYGCGCQPCTANRTRPGAPDAGPIGPAI